VIGREGDENGDEKIKEMVFKLIFQTNKKRRKNDERKLNCSTNMLTS